MSKKQERLFEDELAELKENLAEQKKAAKEASQKMKETKDRILIVMQELDINDESTEYDDHQILEISREEKLAVRIKKRK